MTDEAEADRYPPPRRRDHALFVRCTATDLDRYQAAAARCSTSMSHWVRVTLDSAAERERITEQPADPVVVAPTC